MLDFLDFPKCLRETSEVHIVNERAALVSTICKLRLADKNGTEFQIKHKENVRWLKKCGIDYYDGHINLNSLFLR